MGRRAPYSVSRNLDSVHLFGYLVRCHASIPVVYLPTPLPTYSTPLSLPRTTAWPGELPKKERGKKVEINEYLLGQAAWVFPAARRQEPGAQSISLQIRLSLPISIYLDIMTAVDHSTNSNCACRLLPTTHAAEPQAFVPTTTMSREPEALLVQQRRRIGGCCFLFSLLSFVSSSAFFLLVLLFSHFFFFFSFYRTRTSRVFGHEGTSQVPQDPSHHTDGQ